MYWSTTRWTRSNVAGGGHNLPPLVEIGLTDIPKPKVGNCPPCPPISYVPEVSEWGRCLDGIPMDGDPFYCISYPVLKCIENKTRTVYPFCKDDLIIKMTHNKNMFVLSVKSLIRLCWHWKGCKNVVNKGQSILWMAVIDNILETFPQW